MYSARGKAVITMPIKIVRNLDKVRRRKLLEAKKFSQIYGVSKREVPCVIACRDPSLNHYAGMQYPEDGMLLATENWKEPKCDGDYFTILTARNSYSNLRMSRRERHPFDEMSQYLSREILKAIDEMGLKFMSVIQRRSIGPLVDGRNTFVASMPGTGKTVAFMAPIMERLLRWRKSDGEPQPGHPRALILSPTRELTDQLFDVSKKLQVPPLNVTMIRAGDGNVYAPELEQPGRDLLISTLGAVTRYQKLGVLKLDHLRHVVVDEADTFLSESVRDSLYAILKDINWNRSAGANDHGSAQLIFVASTCPDDLPQLSARLVGEGNILQLTDDNLHEIPSYLIHKFLRLSRKFAPEALLMHVKEDLKEKRHVAVFTKDATTCEWVQHFLIESGIPVVALRGTMLDDQRSTSFQRIVNGDFNVMVATDAAALGLDTRHLRHIINYQLPDTIGAYLRRVGRMGRLGSIGGRQGMVTTFVTNFWAVDFVQELEKAIRLDSPLSVNDIVRDRRDYEE